MSKTFSILSNIFDKKIYQEKKFNQRKTYMKIKNVLSFLKS